LESEAPVADHVDDLQDTASVTNVPIGYRARYTAMDCGNLARTILRYADRGGRPLANIEPCNPHARLAIEHARRRVWPFTNDCESGPASP